MQHLAYQPLLPSGNKYLQQKWDMASYDLHRRKVRSNIVNILFLFLKIFCLVKLEEEWALKIQRENNMLMEKISLEKRQLELIRITKENQLILFRLSHCRSHYNVKSWHEDWLKTLKLMDSIAHYPRGMSETENEKKKEISEKQERETEIQQDTDTDPVPEPNIPEKSISPDTPENPSETIQIKTDKHSVEQSLASDGSEMSNTP
uniref:Uncharacterized protein n=1 Tax=Seriola lalandi dorsalis TaxID=1841481 RepID=A0A3B4X8P9_SERLL